MGQQLKCPTDRLVWFDDDHVQSALEQGCVTVSQSEAAAISTRRDDPPPEPGSYGPIVLSAAGALLVALVWRFLTKKRYP